MPAGSTAVLAVKYSFALLPPEPVNVTSYAVVPQPVRLGAESTPHTNFGSLRTILSPTERGAFSTKVNVMELGASVTGFAMVKELVVAAGLCNSGETGIG